MNQRNVRKMLFFTFLAGIVLITYSKCIGLPFVFDDWNIIPKFEKDSAVRILSSIFRYNEILFYRPLAQLYLFAVTLVFGPNPVPFHAIALCVHLINCLLIISIVRHITDDAWLSILTGLIFSVSTAIHLDPLSWIVGIYDLGALLFFLLSFFFFIHKRFFLSAGMYLVSALFKESTILLPTLYAVYIVLKERKFNVKANTKRLLPIFTVMVVFIFIRSIGLLRYYGVSFSRTYDINILRYPQLWVNLCLYAKWMLQSFFPFSYTDNPYFQWVFKFISIMFPCNVVLLLIKKNMRNHLHQVLLLLFWIALGLLPVVFLQNRAYRYYAICSLPAFICLVLYNFFLLCKFLRMKHFLIMTILIVLSLSGVAISVLQTHRIFREGLSQTILSDGTSFLIRRAREVTIVQHGLKRYVPDLPPEAVLFFSGLDVYSFYKNSGPRFWYHREDIRVYRFDVLRFENQKPYIESPIQDRLVLTNYRLDKKEYLDPSKIFAFQLSKNGEFSQRDLRQTTDTSVHQKNPE